MQRQGSGAIVNNASVGALTGNRGIGAYIASKHGVIGLTRTAALEYIKHGIRVNAVNPGTIDTQIARDVVGGDEQAFADLERGAPIGRAGRPEESAAYASAKAAVIQLTKTLARELGPHGINVNSVAPGTFVTPITGSTRTPEEVAEHIEFRKKSNVMNRLGRLDELANAVLFLASDEASYITGHTLPVDGGRTDRM